MQMTVAIKFAVVGGFLEIVGVLKTVEAIGP